MVHTVHPIRHESSAGPQYFHIRRSKFILFLTPQQFPYDKPVVLPPVRRYVTSYTSP